jgi:hypothetical protein
MLGSCKLFLHIAHVSVHIDHDHTATAFHLKIFESTWTTKENVRNLIVTFFTSNVVELGPVRDMKSMQTSNSPPSSARLRLLYRSVVVIIIPARRESG